MMIVNTIAPVPMMPMYASSARNQVFENMLQTLLVKTGSNKICVEERRIQVGYELETATIRRNLAGHFAATDIKKFLTALRTGLLDGRTLTRHVHPESPSEPAKQHAPVSTPLKKPQEQLSFMLKAVCLSQAEQSIVEFVKSVDRARFTAKVTEIGYFIDTELLIFHLYTTSFPLQQNRIGPIWLCPDVMTHDTGWIVWQSRMAQGQRSIIKIRLERKGQQHYILKRSLRSGTFTKGFHDPDALALKLYDILLNKTEWGLIEADS